MRLEIFDFIDETIEVYDEKKVMIREASKEITHFFEDHFLEYDNVINISGRIKSCQSLKEKILRQDFYLKYKTPENLIRNLSDLIGLRLECRFMEDEIDVYTKIVEFFNREDETRRGYYYNKRNQDILLKLSDQQPQVQKNGFYIYKIDGIYNFGDMDINFELQIKSMVNVFWGEVEHKVLYKNYKYMLSADLFRDMLVSLMENLTMIDRQLMIMNNHLRDLDEPTKLKSREQLESILSKIVYEIYSKRTKEEFGFAIDYRDACDTIISYVLRRSNEGPDYDRHFFDLLKKISKLDEGDDIEIGSYMNFEEEVFYEDDFSREIGETILSVINKDFKWNLFFRIVSRLETGEIHRDFENFIVYFRDCFLKNLEDNEYLRDKFSPRERDEVVDYTMALIAEAFLDSRKLGFITKDNIERINRTIDINIYKFSSYDMWKENKNYYRNELLRVLSNQGV